MTCTRSLIRVTLSHRRSRPARGVRACRTGGRARCHRLRPRASRGQPGGGGGADRRGHRWAGSGPLRRPYRHHGRDGAIVALVLGLIGMVLAGLHLATSTGGIGTGSGRGGAIVAVVLGPIGVVLGGLALARSRRTG